MKLIVKAFVVVLVALAFIAPLAATMHCEGNSEAECATECACICHSDPASACLEQASGLMAHRSERASSTDMLCLGRLSISDIFRPPIAA
jgi:hypothetical protein